MNNNITVGSLFILEIKPFLWATSVYSQQPKIIDYKTPAFLDQLIHNDYMNFG